MTEWIAIEALGTAGLETDRMSQVRPFNSLDIAENVRPLGPDLVNAGGYSIATDDPLQPATANTLFSTQSTNPEKKSIYVCASDAIWVWQGIAWFDRTGDPIPHTLGTPPDQRWSGGWLGGGMTLASPIDLAQDPADQRQAVRTAIIPNPSVQMLYNGGPGQPGDETWESKQFSAYVFRPFREYMFALNLNWAGVKYPSRVQWCDPVEPGQVPVDWVPREENQAGDVDLAWTEGVIKDAAKLQDRFFIYKEDSIVGCEWVGVSQGNTQIFRFYHVIESEGLAAKDCVASYGGLHYCMGLDDIYIFDGNRPQSIIWGSVLQLYQSLREPSQSERYFVTVDRVRKEVLFFFVESGNNGWPTKSLVFSTQVGKWFLRDYATEVPHAISALSAIETGEIELYGIDRTGDRLLNLEKTPDRAGVATPAAFGRNGLPVPPGHDSIEINEVSAKIEGAVAEISLGERSYADQSIVWKPQFTMDPAIEHHTDNRSNGIINSYRVDITATTSWKVGRLDIDIVKTGERRG